MSTKILVVDDENDLEILIRQKFRKQIKEGNYEFLFAENGLKALEVLELNREVLLVLSDINMPRMDGLTLLNGINEFNPLIKVIMVSAYGDMDNIRTAMNRGAFDFVVKPVNFEDLGITVEKAIKYILEIQNTIKAIKENDILKMYVDESVLKFMYSRKFEHSLLANEIIDATTLFVDICGFTSITEKESPDFVVTFINDYFDIIAKAIIEKGGRVDKFLGDAVMAVFKDDDHLSKALETAIAIRSSINAISKPYEGVNTYRPKVAIGICSGDMISGNIGSTTLRRLDYTVIGDVVNTAQRLQSAASENEIFINENDYQKCKDSFKCEYSGEYELKNKAKKLRCYNVLS
jgi:class 3 adenylate cyclase/FixJ family two-component response regulator